MAVLDADADRAESDRPEETSSTHPRRHHWWRWAAVGLAAVILVVVVGPLVLFAARDQPGEKGLEEAVEEYRSSSSTGVAGAAIRPPAGVYVATGEGREQLSFPPIDQHDSAEIPITVEHLADECWRLTVDYNEAHWQTWEYCVTDQGLLEKGGETFQRWDLGAANIDNLATFVCDPANVVSAPDDEVGEVHQQQCTGTNSAVAGTTTTSGPSTYVGEEDLTVDGETVATRHYRQERTIEGGQRGEDTFNLWLTADSGLPVRMEREVSVDTDSPVGAITYSESGDWQLRSLEPAR